MKAYKAWVANSCEDGSTVVFAETAQDAKKIAFYTETCEYAAYIDIRVCRFPAMDAHYHGRNEIDWYDMNDRTALVELGWSCEWPSWECDTCACRKICRFGEGDE